jgi:hypothetical protein
LKRSLSISFFVLSACSAISQVQHADSLLVKKDSVLTGKDSLSLQSLNTFFSRQDSLDIFELIDSLLQMEALKGKSMMALRIGYNSNIIADNRNFNISQFGLAPGVSYYHKTGLYADYSAYWSKEYNPNFYLSVASGGYIHSFSKHYSMLAEYSHYFYNQPSDSTVTIAYTNNVGVTNYFDFKPLILRLDYYLYFGDKVGHRLMPSIGLNFVKRKWAGLDRVSFYPNFNVLFGSEQISTTEIFSDVVARIIYNRTHPLKPRLPLTYEKTQTEFGVMNYAISLPITFTKKYWTFLLSYIYNFPKALPGENLSLQNSGFLSFSITRYIEF